MDMSDKKNGTTPKGIRFPADLEERVQSMAKEQRRAFSQQVIYMIEQYLKQVDMPDKKGDTAVARQLASGE